jgi:hypothetical protein
MINGSLASTGNQKKGIIQLHPIDFLIKSYSSLISETLVKRLVIYYTTAYHLLRLIN